MKEQRILTFFFTREEFASGPMDINEKVKAVVPEENIQDIKYFMQSATETGVYFTVVLIEKKDKEKGLVGFRRD